MTRVKKALPTLAAFLLWTMLVALASSSVQRGAPTPASMRMGDEELRVGFVAAGETLYRLEIVNGVYSFIPADSTTTPTPPQPTPTTAATSTPAPAPVIMPYPDAPMCDEHNGRLWHGLWDYAQGCHYDHEHGMNPEVFGGVWGDWASLTGGGVGYAWETPNENRDKHPGYNWGGFDLTEYSCRPFLPNTGGVNAWLIQAHGMANAMGQQARTHSFFGMASLCLPDGSPAGQILVGGWQDFGQLVSPYKGGEFAIVGIDVYPKAPPPYFNETPPYVGLSRGRGSVETWNSSTRPGSAPFVDGHQLFTFAFRIQDPVGAWQTDGAFTQLGGNSSARQFYQVEVTLPEELAGVDGRINFNGFVDVRGNIAPDCTEVSSTCAPLVVRDGIPGRYTVNLRDYADYFGGVFRVTEDGYYEGDIFFDGVSSGWIGPMN